MNRATWLQGRRMQKFRDVLSRWEAGDLSMMEAGALLGMSERQFRRYRDRFEEDGDDGLIDRRLGKPSPKRVPAAEVSRMLALYREAYRGWLSLPPLRDQYARVRVDRLGLPRDPRRHDVASDNGLFELDDDGAGGARRHEATGMAIARDRREPVLTSDQIAAELGMPNPYMARPRVAELHRQGLVVDSGQR